MSKHKFEKTTGLKSENQTEVLNSVKRVMNYQLNYYFTDNLEDYVENFLNEQSLPEIEGKECKKIKMRWTDIEDMLEEFISEMIDNIDPQEFSYFCTNEVIDYIQSKRSDIEFEND